MLEAALSPAIVGSDEVSRSLRRDHPSAATAGGRTKLDWSKRMKESWDVTDWGQPLQQRLREVPVPQGTEVLLRVTHCGVCHSDLHMQEGYFDLGGAKRRSLAGGIPLPLTMGHEIVGTVLAAAPGAGEVPIGASFLVNPWTGCGECARCGANEDNLCPKGRALGVHLPGGFATHVVVPHPKYLVDISGLDPARAAPLACSGITSYAAIRKLMPLAPEDWIAVVGCGGVGLSAVALLRALGHERVLACDIDDAKLAAATERGAAAVCNIREEGGTARIVATAGGPLGGCLDFVGTGTTSSTSIAALRKGGRYVVCGLMGGELQIGVPTLALAEYSLLGSYVGNPDDMRELVSLAREGRYVLAAVVECPLAEVQPALEALAQGRVVGRQVLRVD
jgi:propanol-preferring alcohol dehydrogenase